MAEPIPIRKNIEPEFDTEREMLDYCAKELREFREHAGIAPMRIAIVLIGDDGEAQHSRCNSWSIEGASRLETCSMAAALLTKRAVEGL